MRCLLLVLHWRCLTNSHPPPPGLLHLAPSVVHHCCCVGAQLPQVQTVQLSVNGGPHTLQDSAAALLMQDHHSALTALADVPAAAAATAAVC